MANLVHKQFFVGGLTSDTHPKNIKEGDYLYMQNMRNTKTSGNEYGGATNIKGNVKVNFDLPSGDNYVIGRLEDKQKQRIFYWVHNSNNNHSLLTYNVLTNEVYYVLLGSYLGLRNDWRITQPSIIDGKIVQWGETKINGVEVEGNPPRYVDTNRAILADKYCEFNIICNTLSNENNSVASYWLEYTENGVSTNYILGQIDSLDKSTIYTALHERIISSADLQNIVESVDCGGCKLEIKAKQKGDIWVSVESTNYSFFTLPQNRYHKDLDETSIKLGRLVPTCQPKVKMIQDFDYSYNYVYDKYFQFSTRYAYWDGQKSTFSNFSTVANIPVGCDGQEDSFNAIEIDFSDDILKNEVRLADIKYIEIVARNGNTGSFHSIEKIDVCDIDFDTLTYIFRNDGSYPQISDEEAYRSYSHIPLLATSHLVVDDRSFWGGTLERYDNLECVEASADVEYNDDVISGCDQKYVTIKGRINIIGKGNSSISSQAIWKKGSNSPNYGGILKSGAVSDLDIQRTAQNIPLSGFTAYLAGTNYYATSKQTAPRNGVIADDNNVYIADTEGQIDNIIEMSKNGGIWSEFEIKNVPKGGRFILRIASHRIGESDEVAEAYNIKKGLQWQKTSTYIRGVRMGGNLQKIHEMLINTDVQGNIIDLTNQPFEIFDLSESVGVYAFTCIDGMLQNTNNSIDDIKTGIQVEYAKINAQNINRTDLNQFFSPNAEADHNGFFFYAPSTFTSDLNSILVGGQTMYSTPLQAYKNNWFKLIDGEEPVPVNEVQVISPNYTEYTVYNHFQEMTQNSLFLVSGKVENKETGGGISNIVSVIDKCSRNGVTDQFGNFSILKYTQTPYYTTGFLYLVNNSSCCPHLDSMDRLLIVTGIGTIYTKDKPYVVPTFYATIEDSANGVWKHRNRLQFGIVYEDEYNRASKVQTADSMQVYIPFWTETNANKGNPIITWRINHTPPSWAKKYQIVRTLNSFYSRYLQFVIDEPRYVIGVDASGEIIDTTYASRQATHVYIPLSSLVTYGEDNVGSILSWDIQPNDRVTFMKDSDGEWYNGFFDFRVQNDKVKQIDDVTYLVIKFDQSQPELKAGATIEVYSMQPESSVDMYYTIGECYGISNGYHLSGADGQNQTSNQAATGKIILGDTYIQYRKMPYTEDDTQRFISSKFESMFMNETIAESRVQHIGRLVTEDRDYGQVFYYTRLRHTGRYLPDTNVNLLNQSAELEYIRDDNSTEIDRQFGVLTSLQYAGSLILAILQFKCVPVYTNATPIFDLQGGSILTKSRSIATIAQPFREDKGSQNPESISSENGNIYAFDRQKSAWWRYGFNGLYDISEYEMHSEFSKIAKELSPTDIVLSCFDRENSELITMYPSLNRIISFNETLAGDANKNRWMTDYTFKMPDYMAIQGDLLVSFLNGELWLHDKGEYGNFYGEQLECGVDFVVNNQPDMKKLFWHIRVKSTDEVFTPPKGIEVYIDQSISPMVSELRENHFERLEGDYWADFRRNMVDKEFDNIEPIELREVTALLKGMPLRGDYMIIKLRNKSNKKVTLYSVDTHSSISNKTNQ